MPNGRITIDERKLRQYSEEFAEVVSSDAFLEQLKRVAEAPEDERLGLAAQRLTPEALRAEGIDLPDATRISSRYFEGSDVPVIELGELRDRPNVVTELNRTNPGILDELRTRNPILLDELARLPEFGRPTGEDFLTVCASVGTPGVPVCVTVGGEV